jgi:hypothetical protein
VNHITPTPRWALPPLVGRLSILYRANSFNYPGPGGSRFDFRLRNQKKPGGVVCRIAVFAPNCIPGNDLERLCVDQPNLGRSSVPRELIEPHGAISGC